jgi:hypothetical protein
MKFYESLNETRGWGIFNRNSGEISSGLDTCAVGDGSQTVEPKKEWYSGGTLHKATSAQWKAATRENKLATAADWLDATLWKGHLRTHDDANRLKVKAQMAVDGVDLVVNSKAGDQLDSMSVAEIAAALITMSNDLGP